MRFSCNACSTKYSLPDEKFGDKVITLTCKKCGAKIVIKPERQKPSQDISSDKTQPLSHHSISSHSQKGFDNKRIIKKRPEAKIGEALKTIDAKESAQIDRYPADKRQQRIDVEKRDSSIKEIPKEKEDILENRSRDIETVEEAIWYYSRGGKQKGPFTDTEIKELVDNNVITPKTFIWKDGMMDWMRAGTYKEFSKFFDAKPLDEKKRENASLALGHLGPDEKYKPEQINKQGEGLEIFDSDSPAISPLQENFFSKDVESKNPETIQNDIDWSSPLPQEESGDLRENTRIFIMRAGLSESAKRKRLIYRAVTSVVLIGIFIFLFIKNLNPILSAVGIKMKSDIDLTMEDLDKETFERMTPEERERYRKALLGIKEAKNLSKEEKKRIAMAIKQKKDPDLSNLLMNTKVEGNTVSYEDLGRERLQGNTMANVNLDLDSKLANLGINTKIEGVDLSPKVGKGDPNLATKIPDRLDTLDENAIMAIVNRNRGSLKYCYERHLKASSSLEGKAIFKLTIQNTGQISRVESLSNKIAGSLFEECILKEMKRWVFPKFSGEPIVFEVPFVLTTIN